MLNSRINVTVGSQMFSIPAEKAAQVIRLLENLQSIQLTEHQTGSILRYSGVSLVSEKI